jgi:SagB-type dehydrogenase family enzyme
MAKKELYRRSTALVAHWQDDDLILENYVKGSRTPLPPQLAEIVMETSGPLTMSALMKALAPVGYARMLAKLFVDRGIFVKAGSRLDRMERAIEKHWAAWDTPARHFYYATRNTGFHPWTREIDAPDFTSRDDPPSPFHERKGEAVALPPFHFEATDRVLEVLRVRRTLRRTSGRPISLDDFSRVVRWTWGVTHVVDNAIMRRFLLKTSPSGGGRHPTEVYAAVLRVDDLEPGLYHYATARDALTRIKSGFFEEELERICCQGDFLRGAAAVFFMTAIVARSMWKYPISHALRVLFLDAGHLGQTFHVVCTDLGLAPFSFAAFNAHDAETFLGIDGIREIPIYACVVGVPAADDPARSDRLGPAEIRS